MEKDFEKNRHTHNHGNKYSAVQVDLSYTV